MRAALFRRDAFVVGILLRLALAAFLVQALIPAGFMPAAGKGLFRLVICAGYGPVEIIVDKDGRKVDPDSPGHDSQPDLDSKNKSSCPFGLGQQAVTVSPQETAVIAPAYYFTHNSPPRQHPATAVLRKTAPPRAPPVFS